jgi:hypothetical protein
MCLTVALPGADSFSGKCSTLFLAQSPPFCTQLRAYFRDRSPTSMQALEMFFEENRIAIRMTPAACASQAPRAINDEVDLACRFDVQLVGAKAHYEFRDDPLLGWLESVMRIGKLFLHCVWKAFLYCNTKKMRFTLRKKLFSAFVPDNMSHRRSFFFFVFQTTASRSDRRRSRMYRGGRARAALR